MHVGAATLPPALLAHLHRDVTENKLRADQVLASLTTIRHQTAVEAETGAPETGSLRAMRVLLRDTPLIAALDFDQPPTDDDLALLAACALGVRRAGTARNRGRGRISLLLHATVPDDFNDNAMTLRHFSRFATALGKGH
jgi:hypothetical protein